MLAFVVGAEVILVPSLRVTTVTAAANIAFQLNPVAGVVALFEALLANNTRWVLFTIHAPPGDIPYLQLLGTNTLRGPVAQVSQDGGVLVLISGPEDGHETILEYFLCISDYFFRTLALGLLLNQGFESVLHNLFH